MDNKVGTEFSLWGGDIHGKNTKVSPNKMLVQDWFGPEWAKPSQVTFDLREKQGVTEVNLTHENVPDGEVRDITQGWKEYYLGPMKEFLEADKGK